MLQKLGQAIFENRVVKGLAKALGGHYAPKMKGMEHHPGMVKRILDAGWQVAALTDFVGNMFPSASVVAEVDVFGSPASNKQDLYWIALAIAFGIIRYDIVQKPDVVLEAMIDHTGRHIRVKYSQSYSGAAGSTKAIGQENPSGSGIFAVPLQQDLQAGKWPGPLQTLTVFQQSQVNKFLPKGTMIAMNPTFTLPGDLKPQPSNNYSPFYGHGVSGAEFPLFVADVPEEVCDTTDTLEKAIERRMNKKDKPKPNSMKNFIFV